MNNKLLRNKFSLCNVIIIDIKQGESLNALSKDLKDRYMKERIFSFTIIRSRIYRNKNVYREEEFVVNR